MKPKPRNFSTGPIRIHAHGHKVLAFYRFPSGAQITAVGPTNRIARIRLLSKLKGRGVVLEVGMGLGK